MSEVAIQKSSTDAEKIEQVLIKGDLAALSDQERLVYYNKVCESLKLNKYTRPFDYLTLKGKLVLYARRECTDQLRTNSHISIEIVAREKIGDVYVVTARAKTPDGRTDESTGAVSLGKSYGDQLANLYMKAETKAKRRVTLSICGLGLLDESEVDSIPNARIHDQTQRPPAMLSQSTAIQSQIEDPGFLPPEERSFNEEAINIPPSERVITFGKKYAGRKFKEFTVEQIESYVDWMRKGDMSSANAQKFIGDALDYLSEKSAEKAVIDSGL